MRIPDWVVYAVVLAVIVGTLFSSGAGDNDPFRDSGSDFREEARSDTPAPGVDARPFFQPRSQIHISEQTRIKHIYRMQYYEC